MKLLLTFLLQEVSCRKKNGVRAESFKANFGKLARGDKLGILQTCCLAIWNGTRFAKLRRGDGK